MSRQAWMALILATTSIAGTTDAQVLARMLLADGDADPELYTLFPEGQGVLETWEMFATVPEGLEVRALARGDSGWGDEAPYGLARDGDGNYVLVDIVVEDQNVVVSLNVTEPVAFPEVEGLAARHQTIYGASFDTETEKTTLITVDPITGVGTARGSSAAGIRIVGLTYYGDRLFGVSREVGGAMPSKLYELDPLSGAATYVMDLPIACESLGTADSLVAAGESVCTFYVGYGDIDVHEFEPHLSTPGLAVGLGSAFFVNPTLESTWGELKRRFRGRDY